MCCDICAINMHVGIRIRGLHLVFLTICTVSKFALWCVILHVMSCCNFHKVRQYMFKVLPAQKKSVGKDRFEQTLRSNRCTWYHIDPCKLIKHASNVRVVQVSFHVHIKQNTNQKYPRLANLASITFLQGQHRCIFFLFIRHPILVLYEQSVWRSTCILFGHWDWHFVWQSLWHS